MELFQAQITLPILLDMDDEAGILGSGVLFTHEGRYFILTAAHLFDPPFNQTHLLRLASPDVRTLAQPTTFGRMTVVVSDRAPFDYDTAVIELYDTDKIRRLKKHWQFLTVDQIALPTRHRLFSLGGFPQALVKKSKGANHGPMFVVRVLRLGRTPQGAKGVDPKIDIFCEYAQVGEVRRLNKEMATPELPGTSGGSLLQYVPNKGKVWSPSTTLKLVGIQSSGADTRKWFRVKNWPAVLNAFEKLDPNLAKRIRKQLTHSPRKSKGASRKLKAAGRKQSGKKGKTKSARTRKRR
jgi:hypothetical protein